MLSKIFSSELLLARKARKAHDWDKAIESLDRCLDILEAQEAAHQSVQKFDICTCETIDTEITKLIDSACPVHGSTKV